MKGINEILNEGKKEELLDITKEDVSMIDKYLNSNNIKGFKISTQNKSGEFSNHSDRYM